MDVPTESFHRVEGWLRLLADKGIKSLIIRFRGELDYPIVPIDVFSAGSAVTTLELVRYRVPPLPSTFGGLPKLTSLHLNDLHFPEHGERMLEVLISRSPLLEKLLIALMMIGNPNGGGHLKWVIWAPKLKALHMMSWIDLGWQAEEFPSLETAQIIIYGPQMARILPSLSQAKKLFHLLGKLLYLHQNFS
ncbi:hypothetical protein E2562_011994 [Oryza meyeriana var. granulata]|uniref:F-box/LRR-repeat protein 15/At3g58940/PEG3-like LRR domain-containing protein n=1 Tax=Oryza meyeriana var. granulata TaxID=110450 RepID=A0A6G1F787_9ORYZ|nr:hypothetical protein E2562_011994 [Oryza meyeriana var. granulata]